jgi:hypothetical protein
MWRARGIFNELGAGGLRLCAECDRANADMRYWNGDVDFALVLIDRALACEELLRRVERGEVTRERQ